jgi:hypothetical protein
MARPHIDAGTIYIDFNVILFIHFINNVIIPQIGEEHPHFHCKGSVVLE